MRDYLGSERRLGGSRRIKKKKEHLRLLINPDPDTDSTCYK